MTQKFTTIQTLDELARLTDDLAREARAAMLSAGKLPPSASLRTLPAEQLGVSIENLSAALTGQALVWNNVGSDVPRLRDFSNGLIYAGSMLRAFRQLDGSPLNVLAMFTLWAASFARDVLEESGHSPAQADALFQGLGVNAAQLPRLLDALPHDHSRGLFMAALGTFYAASHALTVVDFDGFNDYIISAGSDLAGPDWRPPPYRSESLTA